MVVNEEPYPIPVTAEPPDSHSCVNQVICQLRLNLIAESEALELMNEAIDALMNSGYFERTGAALVEAGLVPLLNAEER